MKRKVSIIVLIISLLLLISILIMSGNMKHMNDYTNDLYSLKYDGTWKIKSKNNYDLELEHKKTKSSFIVKHKKLDDSYIDTKLDVIITDIMKSIELQNESFLIISEDKNENSYSYLYENDNEQVLITIIKKDTNLFIVYYNALFENFDIVLDSVEEIIDSMILK